MRIDKCLVCNGEKFEPLNFYYSRFLKKLFHRISICVECGHVQVSPLFSEEELEKINHQFFSSLHMNRNKQELSKDQMKLSKLDKSLSDFISEGMDILDVGAGEAWTMDYFQQKKCNYFAIEAVPSLADLIKARGGGHR